MLLEIEENDIAGLLKESNYFRWVIIRKLKNQHLSLKMVRAHIEATIRKEFPTKYSSGGVSQKVPVIKRIRELARGTEAENELFGLADAKCYAEALGY